MSPHPPLTKTLAVRPVTVSFDLMVLVVRCPKCNKERAYRLALEKPSREPSCPHCGHPWRWT